MGGRRVWERPRGRGGRASGELLEGAGRARPVRWSVELSHLVLFGGAPHGGGASAPECAVADLAAVPAGSGSGRAARSRRGGRPRGDDSALAEGPRPATAPAARGAVPGVLSGPVDSGGRGRRGHLARHGPNSLRARQGGAQEMAGRRTRMIDRDEDELR